MYCVPTNLFTPKCFDQRSISIRTFSSDDYYFYIVDIAIVQIPHIYPLPNHIERC